jgi:hypothetical protein
VTVLFLFLLCVPVLTVPPALLQLAAATSQVAALQDERELQAGVVSDLERILARIERASAGPARPGGSKAAVAGGSLAAVSKQLVQAKLAEADAQRKLRVSAQGSTNNEGRARYAWSWPGLDLPCTEASGAMHVFKGFPGGPGATCAPSTKHKTLRLCTDVAVASCQVSARAELELRQLLAEREKRIDQLKNARPAPAAGPTPSWAELPLQVGGEAGEDGDRRAAWQQQVVGLRIEVAKKEAAIAGLQGALADATANSRRQDADLQDLYQQVGKNRNSWDTAQPQF